MPSERDRLLTTDQAAEHLALRPQTLHEWRTRRVGPVYRKFGRTVRYRLSDLEAYIAERAVEPGIAADAAGI